MIHITAEFQIKIAERIKELRAKLKEQLKKNMADTDNFQAASRLEGNIGALEWVLRESGADSFRPNSTLDRRQP
jgi:adenosylmethionine-8-amino-7-oxononanoate aminotransferase